MEEYLPPQEKLHLVEERIQQYKASGHHQTVIDLLIVALALTKLVYLKW